MHFGYVHNLGATSFFKIIQTNLAMFRFANFALDIFCETICRMRNRLQAKNLVRMTVFTKLAHFLVVSAVEVAHFFVLAICSILF